MKLNIDLKTLFFLLIIVYSITVLLIIKLVDRHFDKPVAKNWHTDSSPSLSKFDITVVIIEFELFDHNLVETIDSFCGFSDVLIISDKPIYPPIKLSSRPNCTVNFVSTSCDVRRSLAQSQPENFIQTDFVLVIPDSVKPKTASFLNELISLKDSLQQEQASIVPVVDGEAGECFDLTINLREWTVVRSKNTKESRKCAFYQGSAAIFTHRNSLLKLNRPFSRPFQTSFYVQSKIHNLNVQLSDLRLERSRRLYVDDRKRMKHQLLEEQRLKWLYQDFGIKKLVDVEGVKWFGCTKESVRCFGTVYNDTPEYLINSRWTPPCCLEKLRITTRHVFKTLEQSKVRYWLEGGSLLGAARNGDIIPWDFDVDVGIYKDDVFNCDLLTKTLQGVRVVDEQGFVWEKASEGDFFRVHFSASNRLHVDLFPFYSKNGTMTKDTWFDTHPQDREFPEHYLKPMTKIRFVGWDAFAPNNPIQFLEFKFGVGVVDNPRYPVDLDGQHHPSKYF